MRIIDFFLDSMSHYSKKEILEGTGISKTALCKAWPELERLEIVMPKGKYGRAPARHGDGIKGSNMDKMIEMHRKDLNVVIGLVNLHEAMKTIKSGHRLIGKIMSERRKKLKI